MSFSSITASPEDIVAALLCLYSKQEEENSFNEYDADLLSTISEKILETHTITERQLSLVRSKLNRYRKKLNGIQFKDHYVDDLQVGDYHTKRHILKDSLHSEKEKICQLYGDDRVSLRFPYDELLLTKIKTLIGRRRHSTLKDKFWTVLKTNSNLRKIADMGFTLPPECAQELTDLYADVCFDGLKKQLRPYQQQGAARLVKELNLRGLLADEMGLGKTAQALAAIHVKKEHALPALVICPSALKHNWAREINMWLSGVVIRILDGYPCRQSYVTRPNEIAIVNYDVLADQHKKVKNKATGHVRKGAVKRPGWAAVLKNAPYKTLVLDECQKIKNQKSQRSLAVLSLASDIPNVIAISGTPIENRPVEFWPVLSMIAPKLFSNFWTFVNRYCDAKAEAFGGWSFKGASNTDELHEILSNSIMIRRLKKNVLKELPTKIRSVIPVEINMTKYQEAEKALVSYIGSQKNDTVEDSIKQEKVRLTQGAEGLAAIERCKQAAVLGKMPLVFDWIDDYLESGRKLVVFAIHTFVLDMLEERYKKLCVRIDGATPNEKRMRNVDAFQGNDEVRLFIGNIKAAGVGLTLTAASDTLTLELGWTPGEHDQAEDRVHRLGQESDSVMAYYIVAKGTIDEDNAELLDQKRSVLREVLDGESTEDFNMITKLMERVIERSR